jgi:hypothetical protein
VARPIRRRSTICSSASSRSEQRPQLLRDDCRAITAPEWPAGAVAAARARHVGCCRLVRVATDTCESLSPIRPTAHRICGGTRSCDRICKNFFRRVRARGNRPVTLSRHSCEHFTRARTARRGLTMVLRNPCATRLSCTRFHAMRSLDRGRNGCSTPGAGHGVRRQRLSATPRDCPPFVKWSRCFLRCAVVIGVQCSSIRECTVP